MQYEWLPEASNHGHIILLSVLSGAVVAFSPVVVVCMALAETAKVGSQ